MSRTGRQPTLFHQNQRQKISKEKVTSDPPSSSFWICAFSLFLSCVSVPYCIDSLPTLPHSDEHALTSQALPPAQPTPSSRQQRQVYSYSEAPRQPSCSSMDTASVQLRNGKWTVTTQQIPTTITTVTSMTHPVCHRNRSSESLRPTSSSSVNTASIRFRQGKWMASENLATNESIFVQFPPLEEDGDEQDYIDNGTAIGRPTESARKGQESKQSDDDKGSILGGSWRTVMLLLENHNEKEWYPL